MTKHHCVQWFGLKPALYVCDEVGRPIRIGEMHPEHRKAAVLFDDARSMHSSMVVLRSYAKFLSACNLSPEEFDRKFEEMKRLKMRGGE